MAEVEGLGGLRKKRVGWKSNTWRGRTGLEAKLGLAERRHLTEAVGRGYNSESQMALRPVWPSVAIRRRTSHKILGLRAEARVETPTGAC